MNRTALVLAAHGSRHEPDVNDRVRGFARILAARRWFDEVVVAFHQGEPGFSRILDRMSADEIIVVPLMTSEGYYSDVVLPRELARNARYATIRVRRTGPVGSHPGMVTLVARRFLKILLDHELHASDTTLALIGHGTKRHARSRHATWELARKLRQRNLCAQVVAAFLDDDPQVESVLEIATHPSLIVIPFLIGDGPHAARDIPRRLGFIPSDDVSLPLAGRIQHRTVVCDSAVGMDPEIVEIIAELARTPSGPVLQEATP